MGGDEHCTQRCVQQMIEFQDPSGIRHEAYWGRVSDFAVFNSPVGVAGFVTGDQGMGHVVIPTAHFDEMAEFFTEVLGFGLSDLMKIRFTPTLTSRSNGCGSCTAIDGTIVSACLKCRCQRNAFI